MLRFKLQIFRRQFRDSLDLSWTHNPTLHPFFSEDKMPFEPKLIGQMIT